MCTDMLDSATTLKDTAVQVCEKVYLLVLIQTIRYKNEI